MSNIRYFIVENDKTIGDFFDDFTTRSIVKDKYLNTRKLNQKVDWTIIGSEKGSNRKYIATGIRNIYLNKSKKDNFNRIYYDTVRINNINENNSLIEKLHELLINMWVNSDVML